VPQVRVEICAGGHQVIVEAPESLEQVEAAAMRLWTATDDPRLLRGFGPVGFVTEQVGAPMPPDLTLPGRLTEWE
jgi:hypothetical protein